MNYALVLENIPLPLIVIDLQSNELVYINTGFSDLIGVTAREIIGKSFSYLDSFVTTPNNEPLFPGIFDLEAIDKHITRIRSGTEMKSFNCKYRAVIEDAFVYGICVFENVADITVENTSVPVENIIAHKNHELRSALTTLVGIAQLAQEKADEHQVSDSDAAILLAGQTILRILDEQIEADMVKTDIREAEPAVPNLVQIIRNAIKGEERGLSARKIQLKFSAYKTEVAFPLDRENFFEVVSLLLNNVIQSTENSEIRIYLYEKNDEKGPLLVFKIDASGMGIKKIYLDILSGTSKAFVRSEISSEDRVYVDLDRSKKIIEEMGGKMVIESQYGIGTTFTISFHLGKEEEIAKILLPGKGLQNEEAGIQEKIAYTPEVLLVDDDQIVFRLISRYLTGRCSLEYAVDGRRALLAVTRKQFDIIFLDINLGIGLTGLQVVKKLRKIPGYEETPVVAITAFAMPGDKERAIASGCTFYQSKPFTRADIISNFNQCLQRIGRS